MRTESPAPAPIDVGAPPAVSSVTAAAIARNDAIDFAKGLLVVTMVVHHTLNYFASQIQSPFAYIRFVSGGFIFISGYIVATFYAAKWPRNPLKVTLRLETRGLKLLALFTLISVALSLLSVSNYRGQDYNLDNFFDHALEIYTIGYTRAVAFYILVPIAYLLMLSPFLLWLQRYRFTLLFFFGALVLSTVLLGRHLNNVTMLLIGGVGVFSGMLVPPAKVASAKHLWWSSIALIIWVATLRWWQFNLFAYVTYIIVVLKFAADFSQVLPPASLLKRAFCLLGEYVLFGYLAQIFLLQVARRLLWRHSDTSPAGVVTIILITSAALVLACSVLRAARRFNLADRAYRLIFA